MVELQTLVDFLQTYSYGAVFGVLILCGLGLPVPEDISLVAGGIISGLGYSDVNLMILVSMVGVLGGDGIVYTLGRRSGDRLMSSRLGKKMSGNKKYAMIDNLFKKHGNKILFAARFMPGLRAPIFFYSGATKVVSFTKFLFIDGFAAIISVPLWIFLGYVGANNREWLMEMIRKSQFGILIVFVSAVVIIIAIKVVKKKFFSSIYEKSLDSSLDPSSEEVDCENENK